jgi:hypothetical protein
MRTQLERQLIEARDELARALERLAKRTLEYVGAEPQEFDDVLECDVEMTGLAQEGLRLVEFYGANK